MNDNTFENLYYEVKLFSKGFATDRLAQ